MATPHEPHSDNSSGLIQGLAKIVLSGNIPNLLIAFGFVLIAGGMAIPFAAKRLDLAPISAAPFIALGALFAGGGITIAVFRPPPPGDEPDHPKDIHQSLTMIREVTKKLTQNVLEGTVLRRDLRFHITILQFSTLENETLIKQKTARVRLRTEFTLENLTDVEQFVPLQAQFEASGVQEPSPISGHLKCLQVEPPPNANDAPYPDRVMSFAQDPNRPIANLYEFQVKLKPLAKLRVEWNATYNIDLPYAELWATSTPVIGMQVEVEENLQPVFDVSADCYRDASMAGTFVRAAQREDNRGVFRFDAPGVFLPYQGIFLRIKHKDGV